MTICVICREVMIFNTKLTICKHKFHKDCLLSWMEIKNECPICRNILEKLYLNHEVIQNNIFIHLFVLIDIILQLNIFYNHMFLMCYKIFILTISINIHSNFDTILNYILRSIIYIIITFNITLVKLLGLIIYDTILLYNLKNLNSLDKSMLLQITSIITIYTILYIYQICVI